MMNNVIEFAKHYGQLTKSQVPQVQQLLNRNDVKIYLKNSNLIARELGRYFKGKEIDVNVILEDIESNYWSSGKKVDVYTKDELDHNKIEKLMGELENER